MRQNLQSSKKMSFVFMSIESVLTLRRSLAKYMSTLVDKKIQDPGKDMISRLVLDQVCVRQ